MSPRLLLTTCVINLLLLTLAKPTFGQKNESLKMETIPHPLRWENYPEEFSIDPSGLTITAGEKTDMFRDPNVTYNTDNAPKLLFVADPDFVLTASIEHSFTHKWDGGALILKQDSLHWVKFCFERDYTGARRVVSVVTKNISDDCNSVEINSNKVFYKVAKAGNVITQYYSLTGAKWFLVRHFQFDTTKPLQVGFLAQSPTGKYCTVKFQNISYSIKKIKDPYLGE
jgi:regulation of enolase protein 1 (concanavalin A-like superfamily)